MCIIKEAAGRVHTDRIGRIQPTCEILVRPASDRLTEKYAFREVVDPPALPCPNGRRLRSPLPPPVLRKWRYLRRGLRPFPPFSPTASQPRPGPFWRPVAERENPSLFVLTQSRVEVEIKLKRELSRGGKGTARDLGFWYPLDEICKARSAEKEEAALISRRRTTLEINTLRLEEKAVSSRSSNFEETRKFQFTKACPNFAVVNVVNMF